MPKKKFNKRDLQSAIRKIFERHPDQRYSSKDLFSILLIKDKNLRKLAYTVLNDLTKEKFLHEFQKGYYILNDSYQTVYEGTVDATSRGSAYIIVPELDQDIYVNPENTLNALNGDKVEVSIIRRTDRKIEGAIIKVVDRKTRFFVGTIDVRKKFAFLMTDDVKVNVDLYIPLSKLNGAKAGEKAVGRITSWPKDVNNPFGEITEVLGEAGSNNTEMLSILSKNEFPIKFPQAVIDEAKNVTIELDQKEVKKRKDLRKKLTLTIDPYDAKDFDDALSFEKLENGNFEVGVHIADVSQYVQPGTAMDKEAYERGNSVYLEDRVIPMLPEKLSNLACSLRPDEDKFSFSAVFELDKTGKVISEWFGKAVIRSSRRLTYQQAQEIIKGKQDEMQEPILALDKIAKSLRKQRLNSGALNIESEEVGFVLDDDGNPVGVVKKVQEDANQLIEEFMLLANKRVAMFVGKLPDGKGSSTDFIYRCHDKPEIEKLNTFSVFIDKFGYDIEFKDMDSVSKKINAFLAKVKGKPEYGLIQTMAIRSMSKADYRTGNIGHYGLAFDYYGHFTSPIRRYADLMVHRILQDKLEGKKKSYGNRLNEISKHISAQERKAIDAERESNKFFQAKYLQDKIGEEFTGTVSGLADFGLFVKMDDNYCEGMIRIQDLPDDTYYFDNERFQIMGRQTKHVFNFGDTVTVEVIGVDLARKQIDLKLIKG